MDEAASRLEALLADRLRILGPDHPHTLAGRNHLAGRLGEIGRVDEAISQYQILLADQTRILGPDHPHTLITRSDLANWLAKTGRANEAISQYEILLADQTRILGPDHPHSLATRNHLACLLEEAGWAEEAIILLAALLDDCLPRPRTRPRPNTPNPSGPRSTQAASGVAEQRTPLPASTWPSGRTGATSRPAAMTPTGGRLADRQRRGAEQVGSLDSDELVGRMGCGMNMLPEGPVARRLAIPTTPGPACGSVPQGTG